MSHYDLKHTLATLTYTVRQSSQPAYLRELLTDYTPTRTLRSATRLSLVEPRTRTTSAARSFSSAAPSVWNSLSLNVRESSSFEVFKRKLKTELFSAAYDG